MTGRRLFLTLALVLGLIVQAGAAPLIVQLGPLSNITSVVLSLGGTVVDRIPGTNIFLLNVPLVPSSLTASLLGIQWMETNQGVTLPEFAIPLQLQVPGSIGSDWYAHQPAMQSLGTDREIANGSVNIDSRRIPDT